MEAPTVYAHAHSGGGEGSDAVLAALRAAAAKLKNKDITIQRAKGAPSPEPGGGRLLPPSSMFSFLRRKPDSSGVVLTEYDGAYIDPFHGSVYDAGADAVDAGRMARVAATLARALATMAFADAAADDAKTGGDAAAAAAAAVAGAVDDGSVVSTTKELARCLVDKSVGFGCLLARRLFAAEETFPSRYTGVVPGLMDDFQHPLGKSDMQRFVWNFLGNATAAANSSRTSCSGFNVGDCNGGGSGGDGEEVCVGATGIGVDGTAGADVDASRRAGVSGEKEDSAGEGAGAGRAMGGTRRRRGRSLLGAAAGVGGGGGGGGDGTGGGGKSGVCVRANPRFVPAFSSRLSFDRKKAAWIVSDPSPAEAALPGGADPIWAESNWPGNIGVMMYQHEGDARDFGILALGVAITAVSYVLARRFDQQVKERLKEA